MDDKDILWGEKGNIQNSKRANDSRFLSTYLILLNFIYFSAILSCFFQVSDGISWKVRVIEIFKMRLQSGHLCGCKIKWF